MAVGRGGKVKAREGGKGKEEKKEKKRKLSYSKCQYCRHNL